MPQSRPDRLYELRRQVGLFGAANIADCQVRSIIKFAAVSVSRGEPTNQRFIQAPGQPAHFQSPQLEVKTLGIRP